MAQISQLISHRFRGFAPHENTLQGLSAALDFGVSQVEFDVRVARCGTPLIYHDEAAQDARGNTHKICNINADERAGLGGVFAHMPTVDALFKTANAHPNKAKLLVDIKDAGFEDMLIALAKAHRIDERIIWVSWLPEALYAVHERLPEANLCLSHWCKNPNAAILTHHKVYTAPQQKIARPERRHVHGERSGWFVDGPLRGELRDILSSVCVPQQMVSAELVEDYHKDGIEVSAFSYTDLAKLERHEAAMKMDHFFIDDKAVFDALI